MAEQKFGGGPLVQVQKGQQNKKWSVEQKMGDGTKIWWGSSAIGCQGSTSASAERSAEQKMVEQKQQNKNCGTKIGGDSLDVGDLKLDIGCWGPASASAKRSVEQKCRTKMRK